MSPSPVVSIFGGAPVQVLAPNQGTYTVSADGARPDRVRSPGHVLFSSAPVALADGTSNLAVVHGDPDVYIVDLITLQRMLVSH